MNRPDTSTFLYKQCVPLSLEVSCPVCHKPFKAYEGKLFCCEYVHRDTEEEQEELVLFCSELCYLNWAVSPKTSVMM